MGENIKIYDIRQKRAQKQKKMAYNPAVTPFRFACRLYAKIFYFVFLNRYLRGVF
jgi:hypothetical protein